MFFYFMKKSLVFELRYVKDTCYILQVKIVNYPFRISVDSLERWAVLSIFLLELEIYGVAIQSIHQKTAKNGDLLGTGQ